MRGSRGTMGVRVLRDGRGGWRRVWRTRCSHSAGPGTVIRGREAGRRARVVGVRGGGRGGRSIGASVGSLSRGRGGRGRPGGECMAGGAYLGDMGCSRGRPLVRSEKAHGKTSLARSCNNTSNSKLAQVSGFKYKSHLGGQTANESGHHGGQTANESWHLGGQTANESRHLGSQLRDVTFRTFDPWVSGFLWWGGGGLLDLG